MDELTDEQVEELTQALQDLQIEVEKALAATTQGSKPVDLDDPIGRLSRMDAIQQQQMAKANRQRMQSQLRLIAQAYAALEEGDYGFCRICEEPIGFKRLQARPESPVCLSCQAARERRR